jgi:hypothetical protein
VTTSGWQHDEYQQQLQDSNLQWWTLMNSSAATFLNERFSTGWFIRQ